jgi:hypothetical protein
MENDSFQYLSVARNLLEGNGLATSLLYFDEQLVTGQLPAPQTVFPPGYSLLMAVLGAAGVPLEAAGYAISAASFALTIWLFFQAGRLLRIRRLPFGVLLLLVATSACGWVLALCILSESLFTAVSLAALLVLMQAQSAAADPEARTGRLVFVGGILAGLSFWVRYAGLFLVAAGLLYYGVRLLRRRSRALRDGLLFGGASLALVALLLGRNLLILGDFRGGNTRPVDKPTAQLLDEFGHALGGLFWGRQTSADTLLLGTITPAQLTWATVALVGLCILAQRRSALAGLTRPTALLLGAYVVVYTSAMLCCGKYTVISFDDPRMFYPLLPVVLLWIGAAFPRDTTTPALGWGRLAVAALLLAACAAYPLLQGIGALRTTPASATDDMVAPAAEPMAGEASLAHWLSRHVGPDDVVLANDGQAFGYYFDRKTVCLASLRHSRAPWTEARLRQLATRYEARFLFVFPASDDFPDLAAESPFLHSLVKGERPPAWVTPVAQSGRCRIFRLRPETTTARASTPADSAGQTSGSNRRSACTR